MADVTEIRLIDPEGDSRPAETIEAAIAAPGMHHAEVRYAYGADCLPGPEEQGAGIWRYRGLLPLGPGPVRYPLPVGGTPLLAPPGLRAALGTPELYLKDETRGPSGSNKDRATALVLEYGLRRGVAAATCASTGNVASSLALGAAAAGMRAYVFVPAEVSDAKLRLMLLAGAEVFRVEQGYEAAFRLSRAAARAFGWLDRNTGVNPLTVDAKKTVAFEIWEQLGRSLPDVVVAPIGDGPTLAALAKGFRELQACGATSRVPRLIGVQSEGCAPVYSAWRGAARAIGGAPGTIAEGIAVPEPVSLFVVQRDVRESGGTILAVPDEEILAAIPALLSGAGVCAEPAGAAAYAGLQRAVAAGLVERGERIVTLVTGSGFKTPQYLRPLRTTRSIRGELAEVVAALT